MPPTMKEEEEREEEEGEEERRKKQKTTEKADKRVSEKTDKRVSEKDKRVSEKEEEEKKEQEKETKKEEGKKWHFVLVHGPCFGGWVWYKVITLFKSEGQRVTAVDLSACGVNPSRFSDLKSFNDYVQPLMEVMASIPVEAEKVMLVGHGFGGLALSLAMERFPGLISVAVFMAALMPRHWSSPAATLDEFYKRDHIDSLMDTKLTYAQDEENPLKSYTYGPKFMASMLYQCCSAQDVTLASFLVRPSDIYIEDISNERMLSEENYGSVNRVYIIAKQDKLYSEDFQRWVIESNPPKDVKEIEGSDHMVMISKPKELCHCLLEIAEKYA